MKTNLSLPGLMLMVIMLISCYSCKKKAGSFCVYEIIAAEGKCPAGTNTKNFCIPCRTPCPQNFDTTVIKGHDTCYYSLRVIDGKCRSCPGGSLPK